MLQLQIRWGDKIIKPKLLLHSCCGPCSTAVIEKLAKDFDLTIFFYNPNILPKEEYEKRLETQKELLTKLNIPLICGEYNPQEFLDAIKGFEHQVEGQERCFHCYQFRIKKTYQKAKELGFEYYTTTLSVSPHKKSDWINKIGFENSDEKTKFLESNFKKQNGYLRSIELSKQLGLYRQNYCGCSPTNFQKTN